MDADQDAAFSCLGKEGRGGEERMTARLQTTPASGTWWRQICAVSCLG